MTTTTTVENFHRFNGHVVDGCVIIAPSGKRFTLKNTMSGWVILGPDGKECSGNLKSATEVEYFVVYGLQSR